MEKKFIEVDVLGYIDINAKDILYDNKCKDLLNIDDISEIKRGEIYTYLLKRSGAAYILDWKEYSKITDLIKDYIISNRIIKN